MNPTVAQRARTRFYRGDAVGAVRLLAEAIRRAPKDPAPYLDAAGYLVEDNDPEHALAILDALAAAIPERAAEPAPALLRARCRVMANDTAGAAELLLRAEEAGADPGGILLVEGLAALAEGDQKTAEDRFSAAAERFDRAEARARLADLYRGQGRVCEAMRLSTRAFDQAPEHAVVAAAFHAAAIAADALDAAVARFSRARGRFPRHFRLGCLHIDLLSRQGRWAEAFAEVRHALARIAYSDGMLDGALALKARADAARPPAPDRAVRLSVCMIVKDVAADLARCLHSVAPVADEFVVVDTGSTDRSPDVARLFGARVVSTAWTDDFSAARNRALELAAGRWILSVDADETLSAADHDRLRALIPETPSGDAAFSIVTRNYTLRMNALGWRPNGGDYPEDAEGMGWFPSEKVRLFPNRPGIRFHYPVHELVEPSLRAMGVPVRPCDIVVHHYGKLNEDRTREKGEAYFRIGMKKRDRLTGDPMALRELAVQAMNLEHFEAAVPLWQEILTAWPDSAEAHLNYGTACWQTGRLDAALDAARIAVRQAPDMPEARFNEALALLHLGRAPEARVLLERLVDRRPGYAAARFMGAVACAAAGDRDRAAAALKALQDTVLGPGLGISVATAADGLRAAGHGEAAASVEAAARAAGIGSPGPESSRKSGNG